MLGALCSDIVIVCPAANRPLTWTSLSDLPRFRLGAASCCFPPSSRAVLESEWWVFATAEGSITQLDPAASFVEWDATFKVSGDAGMGDRYRRQILYTWIRLLEKQLAFPGTHIHPYHGSRGITGALNAKPVKSRVICQ